MITKRIIHKTIFAIIIALTTSNTATIAFAAEGERNMYRDDCGAYSASNEQFYMKLDEMSARLFKDIRKISNKRIAVTNYGDLNGVVNDFGRYMSEEMITRLGEKRIYLVERNLLRDALEELKLNSADLFNPDDARRFGELTGAWAILSGTLTDMGDSIRVNSRLIETETGKILATSGDSVLKTAAICKMYWQNLAIDNRVLPGTSVEPGRKNIVAKIRGKNLVTNGDFKGRYQGWERTIGGENKGSSKTAIEKYPNSKSGLGLHIRHTGEGYIQFHQIIDIADTGLVFNATFEARSFEGPIIGFSGTGITQIALQYQDGEGNVIGQTALVNHVKNMFADTALIGVPRMAADNNTKRYVEFSNGAVTRFRIDISKELEDNLISVDRNEVRKIAIVIWCSATGRSATTELWISDISLTYK